MLNELTPLHIDGLSDFHVHCDYSVDATGSIEDYCEAALQRGLAEICFTTHFDSNPNSDRRANFIRIKGARKPTTIDNLTPYVEDVLAAQDKYQALDLSVKLGIEVGWYPDCEERVQALKDRYDFEFLLVGIHEIRNLCFCSASTYQECFAGLSMEQAVREYYQQVVAAARSGLFTAVAHLDYYKKYGEAHYGPTILRAHEPYLREVFDALRSTDTAMEVNTAARRKGFDGYYPSISIINAAKRAGVDVQFLGSDAHSPDQVGFDFESASSLVPHVIGGCDD